MGYPHQRRGNHCCWPQPRSRSPTLRRNRKLRVSSLPGPSGVGNCTTIGWASADNFRVGDRVKDVPGAVFRQAGVRVEEKQDGSPGFAGAEIHLASPLGAVRPNDPTARPFGNGRRVVAAASVHDDALDRGIPATRRVEGGPERAGLVQGRDDDGEIGQGGFRFPGRSGIPDRPSCQK